MGAPEYRYDYGHLCSLPRGFSWTLLDTIH
jgi:hypothetical protein